MYKQINLIMLIDKVYNNNIIEVECILNSIIFSWWNSFRVQSILGNGQQQEQRGSFSNCRRRRESGGWS